MSGTDKSEAIAPAVQQSDKNAIVDDSKLERGDNDFEVFKKEDGAVDFRTVEWIHASVIFLKGKSSSPRLLLLSHPLFLLLEYAS